MEVQTFSNSNTSCSIEFRSMPSFQAFVSSLWKEQIIDSLEVLEVIKKQPFEKGESSSAHRVHPCQDIAEILAVFRNTDSRCRRRRLIERYCHNTIIFVITILNLLRAVTMKMGTQRNQESLFMCSSNAVQSRANPVADGGESEDPERLLDQHPHFLNVKQRRTAQERHRNREPAARIPQREREG